MKKRWSQILIVSLLLVLAMAVSALADAQVKYTCKEKVKIYEDHDKDSKVYKEIKGGTKILIETTENGWYSTLVQAPGGDGQMLGWIQGEDLSDTMPQSMCPHEWGDWQLMQEGTCVSPRYEMRYCTICGISEERDGEYGDHKYGEWVVTRAATCTQEGERTSTCSVCGNSITESIPMTAHQFSDWVVSKQATCTQEGEKTSTCSVCGKQEKEVIAKTPHKFGDWKVTKEATCTAEGERISTCSVCGQQQKETIQKKAHSFGNWTETKKATCSEEGSKERVCTVCKTKETQKIEKLPHTYEWKIIKEVTDHSAGEREQICKVCKHSNGKESFDPEGTIRPGDRGDNVLHMQQLLADHKFLSESAVDGIFGNGSQNALMAFQKEKGLNPDGICWPQTMKKLEHVFGPWTITKKLDRDEGGERVRICTDCGFEQHETINPVPVIERGARGEDVRLVQEILGALGHDAGTADGIYGQKLDNAFSEFAKGESIEFAGGKLVPSQIDALISAWFNGLPEDEVKVSGTDDPANLVLTVTPVEDTAEGAAVEGAAAAPAAAETEAETETSEGTDEAEENAQDDTIALNYSIVNAGEEACPFNMLLVTFGDAESKDAKRLVLLLDGKTLEARSANTVSGTAYLSRSWGEGNINFTAVSVSEMDGVKLLSNTVTIEQPVEEETESVTEMDTEALTE